MTTTETHQDLKTKAVPTQTIVADPYCDGGTSPPQPVSDIVHGATPAKRKRGKSLSRRTGQDGHIEKSGRWFVVRFWKDISGQEKRVHVRERICPISGPGLLSKSERKRKAREIIQASGADSPEYFKQVVKQDSGITFREQSEIWLNNSLNRARKPIRATTAEDIQRALDKWILPEIGELPLSETAKYPTMRKLVAKMNAGKLSSKTVNTYFQIAAGVVASAEDEDGNPLYPRKWNLEKLDLPIVEAKEQRRPDRGKNHDLPRVLQETAGTHVVHSLWGNRNENR